MVEDRAAAPISEREYEAIEAAVMETSRGRWFLAEFARRNRMADTETLLSAIARLEQAMAVEQRADTIAAMRLDIANMARTLASAQSAMAAVARIEAGSEDFRGVETRPDAKEPPEAVETAPEDMAALPGGPDALPDDPDGFAEDPGASPEHPLFGEQNAAAAAPMWFETDPPDAPRQPPTRSIFQEELDPPSEPDTVLEPASGIDAGRALEAEPVLQSPEETRPDRRPVADTALASADTAYDEIASDAPIAKARKALNLEALAAIDALDTREKLRRFT